MKETWDQSLGQEDPLEMGIATHSSILAWRIPWTEEPDGLQPMGSQESDKIEQLTLSLSIQIDIRVVRKGINTPSSIPLLSCDNYYFYYYYHYY